ncbi:peroxiredoxin family protein [Aquiflexum sp.]|uniref:peroxiredoxin family protein n=1 Tax=Aquiflexum sp. TaxID=1872584 RepID=UPI0035938D64
MDNQGPEIEEVFPDFDYVTLAGNQVSLSSFSDKVVVINVWFVGCTGCKQEEPTLKKITDKYKDRDDVVFLAFAMSNPNKIEKYLQKNGDYGYQQISLTRQEVKEKFGVIISPSHFVIKDGILLSKFIGTPLIPYTSGLDLFQEGIGKAVKGINH